MNNIRTNGNLDNKQLASLRLLKYYVCGCGETGLTHTILQGANRVVYTSRRFLAPGYHTLWPMAVFCGKLYVINDGPPPSSSLWCTGV